MAALQFGLPALQVLGMFGRDRALTGYAIAQETRLGVSTVYMILGRFEELGFVRREPERVDSHLTDRQSRMLYRGTTCAADQLQVIRACVSS